MARAATLARVRAMISEVLAVRVGGEEVLKQGGRVLPYGTLNAIIVRRELPLGPRRVGGLRRLAGGPAEARVQGNPSAKGVAVVS